MAQRKTIDSQPLSANERLLQAVAEQVKLPLIQIARQAELGYTHGFDTNSLKLIELTAERTLRFIDSYLLSNQLHFNQQQLEMEPVSLSSVLNDTANLLSSAAREYGCELQLKISGKYGPVMAHRQGLEAALANLGMAFIESVAKEENQNPKLILAAHASRGGTVAGVFSQIEGLNRQALKRARALYGYSLQPLNSSITGSGAAIFVADSILDAMSVRLRVAHHEKLSGLAATFLPSQQLRLV